MRVFQATNTTSIYPASPHEKMSEIDLFFFLDFVEKFYFGPAVDEDGVTEERKAVKVGKIQYRLCNTFVQG